MDAYEFIQRKHLDEAPADRMRAEGFDHVEGPDGEEIPLEDVFGPATENHGPAFNPWERTEEVGHDADA